MKKTSQKPKLMDILQTTWSELFKDVKVIKDKGRLRNCHKLKESKDINAMNNSGLGTETKKINQKTGKMWIKSLVNSTVMTLMSFW